MPTITRTDIPSVANLSEIMHSPEFQRAESGWMRY